MTIKENITTINQFLDEHNKPTRFGYPIKGIIIHSCVGSYSGSIAWFKNKKAQASAHYVIRDDGEITLCVPESGAAWHAGIDFTKYAKDKVVKFVRDNWGINLNWITIGIEMEDKKRYDWPYPQPQYQAAVELVADICRRYKVPTNREFVLMHREINPIHKKDPIGKWDHEKFVSDVNLAVVKGGEKSKYYNKETTVSVLADKLRVRTGPGLRYKAIRTEEKSYGEKVIVSQFTEGDTVTARLGNNDVTTGFWWRIKGTDLFIWSGGTNNVPTLETVKSTKSTMTKEEFESKKAELDADYRAKLEALMAEPIEEPVAEVPVEEPVVEAPAEEAPVEMAVEETVVADDAATPTDAETDKLLNDEGFLAKLKAKLGIQ